MSTQPTGGCPHRALRPELETLPDRLRHLPLDRRGYPVPWFVAWKDGEPEFRAMDAQKFQLAVRDMRCWVCGGLLGRHVTFVAGPMCGINRTSAEPPSHRECAGWSARNCPFLTRPHMVRREDELINNERLINEAAGIALARNPGVAMLWTTISYRVFKDGRGRPLIEMGEPTSVEWTAEGRPATRAEVDASVQSGLPSLKAVARQQRGGEAELARRLEAFRGLMPLV